MHRAKEFGLHVENPRANLAAINDRKNRLIDRFLLRIDLFITVPTTLTGKNRQGTDLDQLIVNFLQGGICGSQ